MEGDICGKTYVLLKTCQDKKLHNDLTKPCEMCKVYVVNILVVNEWTIIRDIQFVSKEAYCYCCSKTNI